ncbi:MAG: hypothetical protein QG629_907, partial [Patescibacteria group bacterium]|nr:hypothetical protein [Patescibacteria group bacterium]
MSVEREVINTEAVVQDILNSIDREREREIIARRFGLFDRRETLEQVGELLGITRERVRQLEKAVITKLRQSGNELPGIARVEELFAATLTETGKTARITAISAALTAENTRTDQSRIAFLTELCPNITAINEDDSYFQAAAIDRDIAGVKKEVEDIIQAIKKAGE